MITETPVRLAMLADAADIASMSRDYIEKGLGWNWTVGRVERAIRDPETNVAVIGNENEILAFGIMNYREETAHLALFAVRRTHRRRGLGSLLLAWLEEVARAAGVRRVTVECRRDNSSARNFYGEHGYNERIISKGYYGGVEDAVKLEKWFGIEE